MAPSTRFRQMRAAAAVATLLTAGSAFPSTARADPGDDPCSQSATFICRLIPMMPDQEGDIDLTKQQPPAPPGPAPGETRVPTDLCAQGCV